MRHSSGYNNNGLSMLRDCRGFSASETEVYYCYMKILLVCCGINLRIFTFKRDFSSCRTTIILISWRIAAEFQRYIWTFPTATTTIVLVCCGIAADFRQPKRNFPAVTWKYSALTLEFLRSKGTQLSHNNDLNMLQDYCGISALENLHNYLNMLRDHCRISALENLHSYRPNNNVGALWG